MDKLIVNLKDKIIVYPILDTLEITPTTTTQQYTPQKEGYAYGQINVKAVTNTIDSNIKSNNIRENVSILGITGTLKEYEAPTVENKVLIFKSSASVNGKVLEL